jgi:hypothetical protein
MVTPTLRISPLGIDRILSRCSASIDPMCSVAFFKWSDDTIAQEAHQWVSPTSNRGLEA